MGEKFAHWHQLLLIYLKRDWKKISAWVVLLGLFAAGYVPAFVEIASDQGLVGLYETMKNPAMIFMVGPTPVTSAADYHLGAMYAHEMLLFTGIAATVVSVMHVIGHTRKEEDLGVTELISSFRVGRQANSLAVILETVIINLLLVLFIGWLMVSFNAATITTEGAFLYAASIGMAGVMGAVLALVLAQIMPSAASALGSALAVTGLLYIGRAGTDMVNSDLTLFNPMGWTYLTYPFTENNWRLLLYAGGYSVILLVIAFILEGGRDMGTGYLPERSGRAGASPAVLSVPGLFLRLNRGIILSWLIAFVLTGLAYGAIYGDIQTFVGSNDLIKQLLAQADATIEASFTGTIMMITTGLVAILPIAIINKLFHEERRLHLNQVFATPVTRFNLYWTNVLLAVTAGTAGILLAAGSIGGAAMATMDERAPLAFADFIAAGLNYVPLVFFYTGLAALVLGWRPKMGSLVYLYLAYALFINYFGNLVDFPDWFLNTAIQSWLPRMPVEDFDGTVFAGITAISLAMMVIGYLGYNRRDIIEEG